jgi:hypothetical protein
MGRFLPFARAFSGCPVVMVAFLWRLETAMPVIARVTAQHATDAATGTPTSDKICVAVTCRN